MRLFHVLIRVFNLPTRKRVQQIKALEYEIENVKKDINNQEKNKNHYKTEYEKNIKDTAWKKLKYIMLWSRGKRPTRFLTLSIANDSFGKILLSCILSDVSRDLTFTSK